MGFHFTLAQLDDWGHHEDAVEKREGSNFNWKKGLFLLNAPF